MRKKSSKTNFLSLFIDVQMLCYLINWFQCPYSEAVLAVQIFFTFPFQSFKLGREDTPGLLHNSFSWLNSTFAVWAMGSQSRWWDTASIGVFYPDILHLCGLIGSTSYQKSCGVHPPWREQRGANTDSSNLMTKKEFMATFGITKKEMLYSGIFQYALQHKTCSNGTECKKW